MIYDLFPFLFRKSPSDGVCGFPSSGWIGLIRRQIRFREIIPVSEHTVFQMFDDSAVGVESNNRFSIACVGRGRCAHIIELHGNRNFPQIIKCGYRAKAKSWGSEYPWTTCISHLGELSIDRAP